MKIKTKGEIRATLQVFIQLIWAKAMFCLSSPSVSTRTNQCSSFKVLYHHLNQIVFDSSALQATWCVPSSTRLSLSLFFLFLTRRVQTGAPALVSHLQLKLQPPASCIKQHESARDAVATAPLSIYFFTRWPRFAIRGQVSEVNWPTRFLMDVEASRAQGNARHVHVWPDFKQSLSRCSTSRFWVVSRDSSAFDRDENRNFSQYYCTARTIQVTAVMSFIILRYFILFFSFNAPQRSWKTRQKCKLAFLLKVPASDLFVFMKKKPHKN